MASNIDDKELARLEALAKPYALLRPSRYEDTQNICTRAVPSLVAEVRRLREKVEAWEWFEEVRTYDPWREHPYWTACGLASHLHKDQNFIGTKRARAFENAITEWQAILACSTRGRLC